MVLLKRLRLWEPPELLLEPSTGLVSAIPTTTWSTASCLTSPVSPVLLEGWLEVGAHDLPLKESAYCDVPGPLATLGCVLSALFCVLLALFPVP